MNCAWEKHGWAGEIRRAIGRGGTHCVGHWFFGVQWACVGVQGVHGRAKYAGMGVRGRARACTGAVPGVHGRAYGHCMGVHADIAWACMGAHTDVHKRAPSVRVNHRN